MAKILKQPKIYKAFLKNTEIQPSDCDELEAEINDLKNTLKRKEEEYFNIKRNCLKRKYVLPKDSNENFVMPEEILAEALMYLERLRPCALNICACSSFSSTMPPTIKSKKIILKNAMDSDKRKLELYILLTGMEVKSYVKDDHCCVMYHMQHNSRVPHNHALKISLISGNHNLSNFSLPMGFNYEAVLNKYNQIMTPECLGAVRRALVAYYDRLDQYERLQKLLITKANLFKVLDGSHIEITFPVQSLEDVEADPQNVQLMLEYRIFDIRPKQYFFKETDVPELTLQTLKDQCAVFKKKPLDEAFRDCFLKGQGPYVLNIDDYIEKLQEQEKKQTREKDKRHDATFNPDDSEMYE